MPRAPQAGKGDSGSTVLFAAIGNLTFRSNFESLRFDTRVGVGDISKMKRMLLILILLLTLPGWAQVEEIPGGLTEVYQLPGGPKVVLQANPQLPAVTVVMLVRAGSNYDEVGKEGQAHLLEHLMYRAAPGWESGALHLRYEMVGANSGAQTTSEHLVFWETVPAAHLKESLQIQAARLKGLVVDDATMKAERVWLESERKNRLTFEAGWDARLLTSLYPGYRDPWGSPFALSGVSSDSLQQRFRQTVSPARATVALVGGFDTQEVRTTLAGLFPPGTNTATAEPAEFLQVKGDQKKQRGVKGSRAVLPLPQDWDPVWGVLLEAFLSDELGEVKVEQRRLPDALMIQVDRSLVEVESQLQKAAEGLDFKVAEKLRRQALANYYRRLEEPHQRGVTLATEASLGTLSRFAKVPERLAELKPIEIREGITPLVKWESYALVVGDQGQPQAPAQPETGPRPVLAQLAPRVKRRPAKAPPAFSRHELENGLVMLVQRVEDLPTVHLSGYLKGGALLDPRDRPGLTFASALTLAEGIRPQLQELGAELRFHPGRQAVAIEGWVPSAHLKEFMELLGDALRNPDPPEAAFEAANRKVVEAAGEGAAPDARLAQELLSHCYPYDHPYAVPLYGRPMSEQPFAKAEMQNQVKRMSRPDRLVLVLSGDVTDAAALGSIKPILSSWYVTSAPPLTTIPAVPPPQAGKTELPYQGGAKVAVGHPGPARRDPDYYAFNLLNQILGGSPSFSRLAVRLVHTDHIAYRVQTRLISTTGPAPWGIFVDLPPEGLEKVVPAIQEEIKKLQASPPTSEEIERAVSALIGRLQVGQAGGRGRAALLSNLEFHRLSDSYLAEFSGIYDRLEPSHLLRAAKTRLKPDGLVQVIMGPVK